MTEVVVRLLPDGTGRACIHWVYEHPEGKIVTTPRMTGVPAALADKFKGGRYRMACNPELASTVEGNGARVFPFVRSDDARAVTCPRCMETQEFKDRIAYLATLESSPDGGQHRAGPAPQEAKEQKPVVTVPEGPGQQPSKKPENQSRR